jgi:hypothetical protein
MGERPSSQGAKMRKETKSWHMLSAEERYLLAMFQGDPTKGQVKAHHQTLTQPFL